MATPQASILFLQQAARRAVARDDVELAVPDPQGLSLDVVPRDGATFRLGLSDLWVQCRDLPPEQRLEALDRRLEAALHPPAAPTDPAEARRALRSLLRPASAVSSGLGADDPLIWWPTLPCLVEALVCDLGESFAFVRASDLERWGLSPDRALRHARRNLGDEALAPWDPRAAPPLLELDGDGAWGPARLLEPGWLAGQRAAVGAPPVAAAPHAAQLLHTGHTPAALSRLARSAEAEYLAAPRPISPALYEAAGDRPRPLQLPADHPAAEAVALGHLRLAADEYGAADEALARIDPAPRADFTVLREGGRVRSRVRWGQAGELLPEAEEVQLADGRIVPWSQVEPSLEPVQGTWPRWWRTPALS